MVAEDRQGCELGYGKMLTLKHEENQYYSNFLKSYIIIEECKNISHHV